LLNNILNCPTTSKKPFIFVADRFFGGEHRGIKERRRGIYFRIAIGKENPKDAHDIKQYKWVSESLAIYDTTLKDERVILFWSAARAERNRKTYKRIKM
jgi:hypothetical protein